MLEYIFAFPLALIEGVTVGKITSLFSNSKVDFEKLFVNCFCSALEEYAHSKFSYSEAASELLNIISTDKSSVSKALKACEIKPHDLSSHGKIVRAFAKNLKEIYNIQNIYFGDGDEIIAYCFNNYQKHFYNEMTEKMGIATLIANVLEIKNLQSIHQSQLKAILERDDYLSILNKMFNYFMEDKGVHLDFDAYDDKIKKEYKYIEFTGFSPKISGNEVSMELDDIFVDLSLSKNPDNFDLSKAHGIDSIMGNHNKIVVLGDPGSGKSTVLKHIALNLSSQRELSNNLSSYLPLYIRVADYANCFKNNNGLSVYNFILDHIDKSFSKLIQECFELSNIVFLIDGIDEVTDTPLRIKIVEKIKSFVFSYSSNIFIMTSRVEGYKKASLGPEFPVFYIQPMHDVQIKNFCYQWYSSIKKHTDSNGELAREHSDNLFSSLKLNKSVWRLATSPLLLTIITLNHFRGNKLPNSRSELYEICTDTFLEYWVQLRVLSKTELVDKDMLIELLAPVAFLIHKNRSDGLIVESEIGDLFSSIYKELYPQIEDKHSIKKTIARFLDYIRQDTGFLCAKGFSDNDEMCYGFIHLTFQEYLAAIELIRLYRENNDALKQYLYDPRWREAILLAAAQISRNKGSGRKDVSSFIDYILRSDNSFEIAMKNMDLVADILIDGIKTVPATETIIWGIIDELGIIDKLFLAEYFDRPIIMSLISKLIKTNLASPIEDRLDSFINEVSTSFQYTNLTFDQNVTRILSDRIIAVVNNDVSYSNSQKENLLYFLHKINSQFEYNTSDVYEMISDRTLADYYLITTTDNLDVSSKLAKIKEICNRTTDLYAETIIKSRYELTSFYSRHYSKFSLYVDSKRFLLFHDSFKNKVYEPLPENLETFKGTLKTFISAHCFQNVDDIADVLLHEVENKVLR